MVPPAISNEQLEEFRRIKDRFLGKTHLPQVDKWCLMSDDKIWRRVVSQVVVVGNEAPAKRLEEAHIKKRLKFEALVKLPPRKAAKALGGVLAEIGTRYVSNERPENSQKIRALLKNLEFLKNCDGGPRGFAKHLADMKTSRDRIDSISEKFSFIKAKGARDFLTTGLGMATDVIALDSRVMGIVRRIVPNLTAPMNARNYDAIEKFLIERVCEPLGISAVQFDQLLFHNKQHLDKASVVHGGPRLSTSGSSSCRARKQPVAAKMNRRRRSR
jgi:hypothetical protein